MTARRLPRLFLSALFALCLGVPALPAAESAGPPPEHLTVRLSAKSLDDLVEGLDQFLPAATRNTSRAVRPGTAAFMASMFLPLPEDAWRPSEEVQFLIASTLAEEDGKGVFLIRAESFSDFLDALREAGAEVETGAEGEASLGFATFLGEIRFFARDLGQGRLALVSSQPYHDDEDGSRVLADARAAVDKVFRLSSGGPVLPPAHAPDSLVSLTISPRRLGLGEFLRQTVIERIQDDFPPDYFADADLSKTLIEFLGRELRNTEVFQKDVLNRLLAAAGEKLPAALAELTEAEFLRLELGFDRRAMSLALGLEPAADRYLRKIALPLAKLGQAGDPLAARIGADAVSLTVIAPLIELVPDLRAASSDLAGDLLGSAFPDLRDRLAKCAAVLAGTVSGGRVDASYYLPAAEGPGRLLSLSLIRSSDPGAHIQAIGEAGELVNAMLERLFPPEYQGVRLRVERPASGPALRLTAEAAAGSPLAKTLSEADPEELSQLDSLLGQIRLLVGQVDGAVLAAQAEAGQSDDEAYAQALRLVAGDQGGQAFSALPGAPAALKTLRRAQWLFSLIRAEPVFRIALERAAQLRADVPPYGEIPGPALPGDEMFSLGLGADALGLVLEANLPTSVIARFASIFDYGPPASAGDDEDDGYGEDEDEEAGDEEYEYDDEEEEE